MWRLHIGCHRNTYTSRDSDVQEYGSLNECIEAANRSEKFWLKCGYVVWFAYAKGPDGQKIKLREENSNY